MTTPREVVVRYVEAVRDGDTETIRDSFTENATWYYPGDLPISKVWQGRDAIINDFLGSMAPLLVPGTMKIDLISTVAEGDRVVAEWTSRATTIHGDTYDNRCIAVFTVHNGHITSVTEYADTHHVAAVLFPDH